jgi:hypothetical protein
MINPASLDVTTYLPAPNSMLLTRRMPGLPSRERGMFLVLEASTILFPNSFQLSPQLIKKLLSLISDSFDGDRIAVCKRTIQ